MMKKSYVWGNAYTLRVLYISYSVVDQRHK